MLDMRIGARLLTAALMLGMLIGSFTFVHAAPPAQTLVLEWAAPQTLTDPYSLPNTQLLEYQGARIPVTLTTVRVGSDGLNLQVETITSEPWNGTLRPIVRQVPQTSDGDLRPDMQAAVSPQLPSAPAFVVRESTIKGIHFAVIALSPLFSQNGESRLAQQIRVRVNGALRADDPQAASMQAAPALSAPGPTNPSANTSALLIHVNTGGMQEISGAQLAQAGWNLSTLSPNKVHLRFKGTPISLELIGADDGKIDAADTLRFYAPAPNDRYNPFDTYWLTIENVSAASERISTRASTSVGLPQRTTAFERGVWHDNKFYDSTVPGLDGDHWFATTLRSGPGLPNASFTTPISTTLPRAPGAATLVIHGASFISSTGTVTAEGEGQSMPIVWSGIGNWSGDVLFALTSQGTQRFDLTLSSVSGAKLQGSHIDFIDWFFPVQLTLSAKGGYFEGAIGSWTYHLSQLPADAVIYDITNPTTPQRIVLQAGTSQFEDGPQIHRYIVTGEDTLHTPTLEAHTAKDLAPQLNVQMIIIAPSLFMPDLTPLINQRKSQGYSVGVVDVKDIYNAWSYGQTSPEAIRSFLRYAYATWATKPISVLLIGDTSYDFYNYQSKGDITFIPPYLAMVDPWLGEIACETCFVRFDTEDPRDDMLPEIALGRFPVKSRDELQSLIAKLLRYEKSTDTGLWRSRIIYVADNYVDTSGQIDQAGDFAALSDDSALRQPPGILLDRVYYDPSPSHTKSYWRIPDAVEAHTLTLAALNRGAAIVNFTGHSHQWQWAITDVAANPSYLLGLYEPDELKNGDHMPFQLSLTCLTSAFQTPAFSGTTIDERMFLNPTGGAIGIWGSTGMSQTDGHAELEHGFYGELWKPRSEKPTIAQLTQAGYQRLFTNGTCCQDALFSFTTLGDPLMRLQITPSHQVYVPLAPYLH